LPAWRDKAAIELYYMDKLLEEGYDDYIIKPGDEDYVDPDFPFKDMAEMRFLAENIEWDDDEHAAAAPWRTANHRTFDIDTRCPSAQKEHPDA
jgi:hypothetical protein